MLKVRKLRNLAEANKAGLLYQRGDDAWRNGQLRSAFRFFLAAAKAGMVPACGIVGSFYDHGTGVKSNDRAALYWYRRAARDGDRSAANNMGCIWRDRGKLVRALRWFQRAVELGDADANLEIAKVHLRRGDTPRARPYLTKTVRSPWATEQSKEQARLLLKKLTTKKADPSGPKRRTKSASARVRAA